MKFRWDGSDDIEVVKRQKLPKKKPNTPRQKPRKDNFGEMRKRKEVRYKND
jgi:hypothetical protein